MEISDWIQKRQELFSRLSCTVLLLEECDKFTAGMKREAKWLWGAYARKA